MGDPRLPDHAIGIELELSELVEQRQRAWVQGRLDDVRELERQIDGLQLELAGVAEAVAAPVRGLAVHAPRVA